MSSSSNIYKFFAFISYRHTDIKAAKRLQGLLEGYNLPTEIKAQVPDAPKRFKVFRDTDELTSGVLSEVLQKKLDESKFLIVICSPDSAQSKYVGEEIAYFRSIGRERQIIPFIIDGIPHSNDKECFHPQLTLGGLELLGIDVQAEQGWCERERFHKAFIRTVAKMLGLDFGVLWNKRRHQLIRQAIYSVMLTIMVVAAIAFFALKAQHEKPFDAVITLKEGGVHTTLPLSDDGRDSVCLYLDDNDVRKFPIKSLNDKLSLQNIPGRYKDKGVRVVCSAFGCNKLDTVVVMSNEIALNINRNPETFGRIRHYVMEDDGETPVANAEFDFGCIKTTTDTHGLLDVLIPLEYQQAEHYKVNIIYNGVERKVAYQSELDPFLDRTEISTIVLESISGH